MLLRKPKGKFAVGREPWELMGIKRAAFYARHRAEEVRGDDDGAAHRAMAQALEIGNSREPYAPEEPRSGPMTIIEPDAALEPDPVVVSDVAPASPVAPEPAQHRPALSLSAPSEAPTPAVAGATVNVTLRSLPAQHQRLRRMSYETGRPIQSIVSDAVDEYLSKSRY